MKEQSSTKETPAEIVDRRIQEWKSDGYNFLNLIMRNGTVDGCEPLRLEEKDLPPEYRIGGHGNGEPAEDDFVHDYNRTGLETGALLPLDSSEARREMIKMIEFMRLGRGEDPWTK